MKKKIGLSLNLRIKDKYVSVNLSEEEYQKLIEYIRNKNIERAKKLWEELKDKLPVKLINSIFNLESSHIHYEIERIVKNRILEKLNNGL